MQVSSSLLWHRGLTLFMYMIKVYTQFVAKNNLKHKNPDYTSKVNNLGREKWRTASPEIVILTCQMHILYTNNSSQLRILVGTLDNNIDVRK